MACNVNIYLEINASFTNDRFQNISLISCSSISVVRLQYILMIFCL